MRKWMSTMATLTALFAPLAVRAGSPDFRMARGSVLIAAPTAGMSSVQGVWFIQPMNKMFSLQLPPLLSNQVYEGWLIDDCTGTKISTGIFRAEGGTDSDAAGSYAGGFKLNFPPVPGSDFVTLGQNLSDGGHHVVITVEPYPDRDPQPSGFAVLRADIPAGTMAGTELNFINVAP